jgi:adenosylcobinamide-GDP ribazoletransferase
MGWSLGCAWLLARRRLAPLPAAVVVVAADCALTGGLHLDGLADTADGLFAHAPTKTRLQVMAEPQVGTYACVAVGLGLLGRAAALGALEPSPWFLAALYCCSRSVMVLGSRMLPYARPGGLAKAFLPRSCPGERLATGEPMGAGAGSSASPGREQRTKDPAFVAGLSGVCTALLLALLAGGRRSAGALGAGLACAGGLLVLARKRLGGFTGDVLGASGVVCETVALLAEATRSTGHSEPKGASLAKRRLRGAGS